jgi:glutamate/tyrosine decarboxylase-like PLP-dependent enzyme
VEKGVSKIPLEMSRLTDEDLVNIELEERQAKSRSEDSSTEEKTTRAESMMGGMPQIQFTDQLEEQDFIHRGRMYQESKKSMINFKGEEEEEMKHLID